MKKVKSILFFMIISTIINFAQVTFQKSFTNANFSEANHYDEEGYGATQTSDGNYLLTGLTRDESGNADVILTKHDKMGNIIWEKIYGSPAYDKGYAVAEIMDGGIVVAAKTNKLDDDGDWWILRMDENGDTLWTKSIGFTGVDIPYKVIPLENGNFVVAGQVWGFYNCVIRSDDGYIVQFTPEGEEVWHHIVQNSIKDPLKGITQTSDGGFVVCGNARNDEDGIYDTYAYKIDGNGQKKWVHTYKYTNSDEEYNNQRANAITELPNGELVMVGKKFRSISSNTWNVMFKRLDRGGNILRDTYDYEIGDEEAMDVLVNEDGNLVVVGNTESHVLGGAITSIFVSIYDTSGTKISEKLLGANSTGHNWGYSVSRTSDNGLVVGGYVTIPSEGY